MIFKLLFAGLALFLLFKLFTGDKKKKEMTSKKETERMVATGEMVKDPVCGTYVQTEDGIRVREGDKLHYFCSYECRDKYIKSIQGGDDDK